MTELDTLALKSRCGMTTRRLDEGVPSAIVTPLKHFHSSLTQMSNKL